MRGQDNDDAPPQSGRERGQQGRGATCRAGSANLLERAASAPATPLRPSAPASSPSRSPSSNPRRRNHSEERLALHSPLRRHRQGRRIRLVGAMAVLCGAAVAPITVMHQRLLTAVGGASSSAMHSSSSSLHFLFARTASSSPRPSQIQYEARPFLSSTDETDDDQTTSSEGQVSVRFRNPSLSLMSRGPPGRRPHPKYRPDHGGLLSLSRTWWSPWRREIPLRDEELYHDERTRGLDLLDAAADPADLSQSEPGKYFPYEDQTYPDPRECYRPKWSFETHPNCNAFHEIPLERGVAFAAASATKAGDSTAHNGSTAVSALPGGATILGLGHYRLPWLLAEAAVGTAEVASAPPREYVLKNLRLNRDRNFNHKTFAEIQVEALAFTLTAASMRTVDLYGHCGTSVAVERGVMVDKRIRPDKRFHKLLSPNEAATPRNALTPRQKLDMALAMAESVALLHGNTMGPIVNNDIKLDQWIMTSTGYKLNDFNKGKVLRWNPTRRQYCSYYSSYDTVYRAPEELVGSRVDESPDVYALGKVLYTVLTGYVPHYEHGNYRRAYEAIVSGAKPPYVHDRYRGNKSSFVEGRLVEIMERCYAHRPEDRPSIFEVVRHLRETAAAAVEAHQEQRT